VLAIVAYGGVGQLICTTELELQLVAGNGLPAAVEKHHLLQDSEAQLVRSGHHDGNLLLARYVAHLEVEVLFRVVVVVHNAHLAHGTCRIACRLGAVPFWGGAISGRCHFGAVPFRGSAISGAISRQRWAPCGWRRNLAVKPQPPQGTSPWLKALGSHARATSTASSIRERYIRPGGPLRSSSEFIVRRAKAQPLGEL
jgi:hypothetical protein